MILACALVFVCLLISFHIRGRTTGTLIHQVDIELFDSDSLFGQSFAQQGKIVQQQVASGTVLRLETRGKDASLDLHLQLQRAQLWRAEPDSERAALAFRRLYRARYSVDEPGLFRSTQTWTWIDPAFRAIDQQFREAISKLACSRHSLQNQPVCLFPEPNLLELPDRDLVVCLRTRSWNLGVARKLR